LSRGGICKQPLVRQFQKGLERKKEISKVFLKQQISKMNQKELNQVQSELQKGAAGLATETAKIQHDYIFVKEENQFVHITNCRTCEDKKEQKKAETNEAADSKKPYKLG
ncbi:15313_t:CDS:2, partial [Racocetra persica]